MGLLDFSGDTEVDDSVAESIEEIQNRLDEIQIAKDSEVNEDEKCEVNPKLLTQLDELKTAIEQKENWQSEVLEKNQMLSERVEALNEAMGEIRFNAENAMSAAQENAEKLEEYDPGKLEELESRLDNLKQNLNRDKGSKDRIDDLLEKVGKKADRRELDQIKEDLEKKIEQAETEIDRSKIVTTDELDSFRESIEQKIEEPGKGEQEISREEFEQMQQNIRDLYQIMLKIVKNR